MLRSHEYLTQKKIMLRKELESEMVDHNETYHTYSVGNLDQKEKSAYGI